MYEDQFPFRQRTLQRKRHGQSGSPSRLLCELATGLLLTEQSERARKRDVELVTHLAKLHGAKRIECRALQARKGGCKRLSTPLATPNAREDVNGLATRNATMLGDMLATGADGLTRLADSRGFNVARRRHKALDYHAKGMAARHEPGLCLHCGAHRGAKPHELGDQLALEPRNLSDAPAKLLAV